MSRNSPSAREMGERRLVFFAVVVVFLADDEAFVRGAFARGGAFFFAATAPT